MEKVVRVSIANVAFVLEEDAYRKLDAYLSELKAHYSAHENGSEIIDGIEERMADLFMERVPNGGVVPVATAQEVIALLGRPDDIEQETGEAPKAGNTQTVAKRLYRDPDRRILGGVCSGLSAYLNIDVVWIRLLFVGLVFCTTFIHNAAFVLPGIYIVLWIVVPKARTVAQKYAMRGEAFSISGIERNVEGNYRSGASNEFWQGVGRVIVFCIGILLAICGIGGIIGMMVAVSGLQLFHNSFGEVVQALWNLSTSFSCVLKCAFLLAVFLPFIGMLYSGIRLLFRFKSPGWRPGLVIFLLWVAALITTVALSIYISFPYFKTQRLYRQETVETKDTIYIKYNRLEEFPNDRLAINAGRWGYNFALLDNQAPTGARLITWPQVYLSRDKAHQQLTVRSETSMFTDRVTGSELKEVTDMQFYRIEGDTLFLDPLIYDKGHGIREIGREVTLDIRPKTQVIIEKPVSHRFDRYFEHNNWLWLLRR
ncbi:MAG: PspC domain-containing protein [Culturomica sp.]|jgi:phage shock protein PspC (stress-responsive transcriptional regulator)|nr:PspC domain-containing protein [Culturomica sp.]